MPSPLTVSVVIPVRDGSGKLERCLESLLLQDIPRDHFEIIVADGLSTDNTVEIAKAYGCIVVTNLRQTVAGGRNAGFAVARGKYIASTEDDIVLPPGWLSEGMRTLEETGADAVGGPTPIPPDSPPFARAVDVVFRAAASTGYSVQSGKAGKQGEAEDLPGGNSMYRKSALDAVLPVNELLVTGEDVELHLRMRALGMRLVFSPKFLAWHHKRDAPRRFFRQIRRFAQGRIQVGRLRREAMRPVHWLMAILPLPAVALIVAVSPIIALYLLVSGAALSMLAGLGAGAGLRGSFWMPVVAGMFLLAWPTGVFQEVLCPTRDATGK